MGFAGEGGGTGPGEVGLEGESCSSSEYLRWFLKHDVFDFQTTKPHVVLVLQTVRTEEHRQDFHFWQFSRVLLPAFFQKGMFHQDLPSNLPVCFGRFATGSTIIGPSHVRYIENLLVGSLKQ